MKHFLTLAFILTCLLSNGQSSMFWNNYSNLNPAMSGLQHQQHGALSIQNYTPSLTLNQPTAQANYNMRLSGKHGVGINYSGDYYSLINNKIALNYNYQFNLKTAGKLSTGIGLGAGRTQFNKSQFGEDISWYNPSPYNYFNLSFGVAYSRGKLNLGVSTANLFSETNPALSSYKGYRLGLNAHVAYTFQLGENFELTPRTLFTAYNGFNQLRLNVTTTFKKKFSLGLSARNTDYLGFNIGWDIHEKFRVAYAFGTTFSKLNNGVSGGIHEFTIGYFLKTQAKKLQVIGTPSF